MVHKYLIFHLHKLKNWHPTLKVFLILSDFFFKKESKASPKQSSTCPGLLTSLSKTKAFPKLEVTKADIFNE
ncbi:hypothetical protein BXU10_05905 [Flavobacterium sp. LM4]|nr:hypothetical protein BXU10_05905 [Flavobacterium sp. LM4]